MKKEVMIPPLALSLHMILEYVVVYSGMIHLLIYFVESQIKGP